MGKYGNKVREDKSVLTEPLCPFCRQRFERPVELPTQLGFITGGKCLCGAAYIFDPSTKNMGEAYLDALVYACGDDWDRALKLTPEVDYDIVYLNYNVNNHTLTPVRPDIGVKRDMVFVRLRTG